MYLKIIKNNSNIVFEFNLITIDVLWDFSKNNIPFSKDFYYNYQDLLFIIMDSFNININVYLLVEEKNISFIFDNLSMDNIILITKIINNYIDSKFIILN